MGTDAEWDARYASAPEGMFSGKVNGTLAVEVEGLPPGRALDVGCGEGADAIWLARRGWRVTALDVSAVAVQRAAAGAPDLAIDWVAADFATADLDAFDLVTLHYPALGKTPDHAVERALLAAVAPGGTLLCVGHAPANPEFARARGFDPEDFVLPKDVRAFLPPDWTVVVHEERPRPGGAPHGSPWTHDEVLRATRP